MRNRIAETIRLDRAYLDGQITAIYNQSNLADTDHRYIKPLKQANRRTLLRSVVIPFNQSLIASSLNLEVFSAESLWAH
jgi:hypothetical protein